jgi:hypothetical protein
VQYRIRVYEEMLRALERHVPADVTLVCRCRDPWPCREYRWATRVVVMLERRAA